MKNESAENILLTVGFPVSNSAFSAFDFKSIVFETDGNLHSVFNRLTKYPGRAFILGYHARKERRYILGF